MTLDIRAVTRDEFVAFVTSLEIAAGRHVSDEVLDETHVSYELDRTLAAFDQGRIVGGTGSDVLELTLPGLQPVRAARITLTAMLPTHRRRGLLTALWKQQLRDLRHQAEPIAIFTTSGPGIYGRVGYSPATVAMSVEIESAYAALRVMPEYAGSLRILEEQETATILPEVFERHRLVQPGQVSRKDWLWRNWLLDRRQDRSNATSGRFITVFEDERGSPQGYLAYRLVYGPLREQPVRELIIEELVTTTDEACRALWAYSLGFDQARTVRAANISLDEPVRWLLADPRRLRVTELRDFLWLRLVDVPVALAARGYSTQDTLVFEVTDEVCPENEGRYRLETESGDAICIRTAAPADLALGVAELAATYLGGGTFTALARAGRVVELSPGALVRADALFACRPTAWTVTDW